MKQQLIENVHKAQVAYWTQVKYGLLGLPEAKDLAHAIREARNAGATTEELRGVA